MDIGLCIASYVGVAAVAALAAALATRAVCNRKNSQAASEEQIRDLVTDSEELLDDEKSMIHEIIELGDMTAVEVMQPRMDMILVEDTDTVRQAAERMTGTGYSRLPVYHEDYDHIIGIVHYKDLFPALVDGRGDEPVGSYAFEPMYVPVTKDVLPLLSEMQHSHQQMAIVVDEYGGTGGVITFEDIVEEIVGEILDEKDRDGSFLRVVREGEWVADGRLPIKEAAELGWPVQDSDDYETLAGWLMSVSDTVPQTGDVISQEGFDFKIEGMRRRRVKRVRVRKVVE